MKKIKSQYILVATIVASCYFLFLFLNTNYNFIEANSFGATFVELLTLPFIILEILIAICCLIYLKEKKAMIIISFVLSLATIIAMFFVQ